VEVTATVINVKFGTIEENGMEWAQVNIIDNKLTSNDGFHGVQPAKLKMVTDNRNELAMKLTSELRKLSVPMPCKLKLHLNEHLQAGEMKMIVSGYELIK